MKSSTVTNITCISISAIALSVIIALLVVRNVKKSSSKCNSVVKLLQNGGWKLLGTDQCMWTQQQKTLLGSCVDKIYVNCQAQPQLCTRVEGVPTWFNERSGKQCLGFQSEQDIRTMVTTGTCPKPPPTADPEMPSKPTTSPETTPQHADVARAAHAKGLAVLGTTSCGWTKRQLDDLTELVGAEVMELLFVDCTQESNKTVCAPMSGFPTWTLNGKSHAVGYKPPEEVKKMFEEIANAVADTTKSNEQQAPPSSDQEPVLFAQENGSESPNFEQTFYKSLSAK